MTQAQSKKTTKGTWLLVGGMVIPAAIGMFFLIRSGNNSCQEMLATMITGEDRAVVACRSQTTGIALWLVALSDGHELKRADIDPDTNEWANVIGQAGDRLWVGVGDHGLRAYGSSLTSVQFNSAVASHSILSRGTSNASVSDDGAVLQGGDGRLYLVTRDGSIERFEGDRGDTWRAGDKAPTLGAATRENGDVVRPDGEALVQPRILAFQNEPIWINDGDAVLAVSIDVSGADGNDRLSGLDSAGQPLWTAATEELMRAAGANSLRSCRLRDIDVTSAEIWATIVCAGKTSGAGNTRIRTVHDSRLIAIDPATGNTLRALELHVAD